MYLLKYEDEYGSTHYHTEKDTPVEFKTIEEAEKKAEELLDMEYEDFGSAITQYYIVEVGVAALKRIKSFKVCDDGKECILSCTGSETEVLNRSLLEVKKKYDVTITSDKTYTNGARVVKFKYDKKGKEEDCDIILKIKGNTFEVIYDTKDRMEMSALAYAMKDKYKDELSYFCDERVNNAGKLTFKVIKSKEEFKEDILKCAEIFFKVKVLEL